MKPALLALALAVLGAFIWLLMGSPDPDGLPTTVVPVAETNSEGRNLRTSDVSLPEVALVPSAASAARPEEKREVVAVQDASSEATDEAATPNEDLAPPGPRIVGRVLFEDGTLFASRQLHLGQYDQQDATEIHRHVTVMTTAEGRFSITTGRTSMDGLVLFDDGTGRDQLSFDVVREFDFSEPIEYDLGDVVLTKPYLLASGRVVEAGLGGIAIELSLGTQLPDRGRWLGRTDHRTDMGFALFTSKTWSVTSADDGYFEFWGKSGVEEVYLRNESRLHLPGPRTVVPVGEQGIHFELRRGGHFVYKVPEVEAIFPNGRNDSFSASVDQIDGRQGNSMYNVFYDYGPLEPGLHRLAFYLGWDRESLLHEMQVEIVAGEITDLGDVYFSTHLYHYELQIDAPGKDFPKALKVEAARSEPNEATVHQKAANHEFFNTGKVGAHLFSLAPIDQVRVSMGGDGQLFSISEGLTEIEFTPL